MELPQNYLPDKETKKREREKKKQQHAEYPEKKQREVGEKCTHRNKKYVITHMAAARFFGMRLNVLRQVYNFYQKKGIQHNIA